MIPLRPTVFQPVLAGHRQVLDPAAALHAHGLRIERHELENFVRHLRADRQAIMAYLYEFGIGVKIRIELAESLLKKSAQVLENGKIELLRFYKRQYKSRIINQKSYNINISELKKIVPKFQKKTIKL